MLDSEGLHQTKSTDDFMVAISFHEFQGDVLYQATMYTMPDDEGIQELFAVANGQLGSKPVRYTARAGMSPKLEQLITEAVSSLAIPAWERLTKLIAGGVVVAEVIH
jgi:hypothetical protein